MGIGLVLLLLAGCSRDIPQAGGRLVACAAMPEGRAAAVAFGVGEYGYVFGGRDGSDRVTNSLWRYDVVNDSWDELPTPPLSARVSASAVVVNDKVYVGLGFSGTVYRDSAYRQDWWCYTPADGSWQQLASYPNRNTVGAVCVAEEGYIYSLYGMGGVFSRDVIRYDIARDNWAVIPEYPGKSHGVMGGAGASVGSRHFFGTGYNTWNKSTWYEVTPEGAWQGRADVPGKRSTATATAAGEYIYLTGGRCFGGDMSGGCVYDDVLRYDVSSDTWSLVARLPEGRDRMCSFTVGGKVYVGLGETIDYVKKNTLFRIED